MSISEKVVTGIKYTIFFSAVIILGIFLYDLMFAPPLVMKGVIVEKKFVAKENVGATSVNPYMRYKQKDYLITTQNHDQWIALVELENGQVLKVNCHSDHYQIKEVGDTLHFKEYAGDIMGIDYFSHNEEDEEAEAKSESENI